MLKVKISLIFAAIVLFSMGARAQGLFDEIRHYRILPNKDTLVIDRTPSNWRIGALAGPNIIQNFGSMNINDINVGSQLMPQSFKGGGGGGYFVGLMNEWLEPNAVWGIQTQLRLFDRRKSTVDAGNFEYNPITHNQAHFTGTVINDYISFSALARYNIAGKGLHFLGGYDLDFLVGHSMSYTLNRDSVNPEYDTYAKSTAKPNFIKFGLNLGVAWDIPSAIIAFDARSIITPFASIHIGTPTFSSNGSNWNSITFKAGFQLKFSIDHQKIEVLKFDSTTMIAPSADIAMSGVSRFKPVEIKLANAVSAEYITPLKRKEILSEEIAVKKADLVIQGEAKTAMSATPSPTKYSAEKVAQLFSKPRAFTFKNNKAFAVNALSKKDREELDALADYASDIIKKGGNVEIAIVGHTDANGTAQDLQALSEKRAKTVLKYLESKGVNAKSILVRGVAGNFPKTDQPNALVNNRVEIQLISKKK